MIKQINGNVESIFKITSNNERRFSVISCTYCSAIVRLIVIIDFYFVGRQFARLAIFIILLVLEWIDHLLSYKRFASLKIIEKDVFAQHIYMNMFKYLVGSHKLESDVTSVDLRIWLIHETFRISNIILNIDIIIINVPFSMFIAQVTDNKTTTQIQLSPEQITSTFTSENNSSNFWMCGMAREHA